MTQSYTHYPELAELPRLVARQRALEKQVETLERLAAEEKALRGLIDALLVAVGVKAVTCHGYDVVHHTRAGQQAIDRDKLVSAGVSAIDIRFATVRGKPASFATVRPIKGSDVVLQLPEAA